MEISTGLVGDLPLLHALISQTGIADRLDKYYKRHHLWQGPSFGQTLKCFLLYILSENNHSLYKVESWAAGHKETLQWLLSNPEFKSGDMNDDRLGILLDRISKSPELWQSFQRNHNDSLIRFYDLSPNSNKSIKLKARLDSTTAQSNKSIGGLFQKGHNASGSDLAQMKMMMLALDKGNLALSMHIAQGQKADDNLYIPAIELAWEQGLHKSNVLLVGDTKLCNGANMGFIANSGNYYLGPLAKKQYSTEQLLAACQWIEIQQEKSKEVKYLPVCSKEEKLIALAKELPSRQIKVDQNDHTQRLIAACIVSARKKQLAQLESRIEKAEADVKERLIRKPGRRTLKTQEQALQMVQKILTRNKVSELFDIQINLPDQQNKACQVNLLLNQQAYQNAKLVAGWRIFATNAPKEELPEIQVVLCYWEEYRIEQQFHLLLNKTTALLPILLQKENRIKALIQILMLALQFSNLWEYTIRKNLKEDQTPFLKNVVPGNPGRIVKNPTTQLVLTTFKYIQFIKVILPDKQYLTFQGLEEHHIRIIKLLGLSDNPFYKHPLFQRT